MSKEAPVILLINSPQNSKTPQLSVIDLLGHPAYKKVVDVFDQFAGLPFAGSLGYDRQYASVVHSVAAFNAFAADLKETSFPGSICPPLNYKFMGHSVGEMAAFVEAGILDIPATAQLLSKRQFITEHPLGAGLKYMLAAVGLDVSRYEEFLFRIKDQFQGKVEAVIANFNSPSEGVLSVQVAEDAGEDAKSLASKLSLLKEFKSASAERFKVVWLPIANAFHSSFMRAEEGLFIHESRSLVESAVNRVEPGVVYSPMMPGWVNTKDEAIGIILHQLTRPVNFVRAMEDILTYPGLMAIITCDVKGITPAMVQNNLAGKAEIPVFNIDNKNSLIQAVEGCNRLYRR